MAVPVNPMAGFAVRARNPIAEVIQTKGRGDVRAAARQFPAGMNEFLRNALNVRLMGGGGGTRPSARVGAGIGSGGGMIALGGMPQNEQDVMERDKRERLREVLLQQIRSAKAQQPDAYAREEAAYMEDASKRGRFLKKAYDAVGTPEGYSQFDLALMRTQGVTNPLLDEYNPVTRERVAREFQRTHKWARNRENLSDLDVAVKYLMSRPNFEQSFYYNP